MTTDRIFNIPQAEGMKEDIMYDFNERASKVTPADITAFTLKIEDPKTRADLEKIPAWQKRKLAALFNMPPEQLKALADYWRGPDKQKAGIHDLMIEIGILARWTGNEKLAAFYEHLGGKAAQLPESPEEFDKLIKKFYL